ncbi:chemotaxis protein CheB [Loktanella sp. M215]|uniref:chemotaxis protein CheB n=1 Tax=Loktanella sp. M215 TaxID=2675431 RepID=UPI001F443EE6|nr:chemotaxis protein CheB [Loktanella sp. M215]
MTTTETNATASDEQIIVGIGASAGGLEAIQSFLDRLPDQHDLVFVIVQHLDPDHDSLMEELLNRRTKSPVVTAYDGCKVEPGHIYLIAPGELLTIEDNTLRTEKFAQPRGIRRPIDVFLTSLANHSGLNAVGVILSGTGSDGSHGVRDIKNNGGLVLVQRPEEAKYNGMPRAAIASGACDLIVPVAEIVPALEDFFHRVGDLTSSNITDGELISRVARHLRNRTGHDFSEYKPGTLLRRIAVRMSILGLAKSADYLHHLINDPQEAEKLFSSILINVTSFFRDDDVFDALRESIIPDLVSSVGAGGDLRVWVAGCSTGEEAYSLAIILSEAMERQNIWPRVSIFATDIDEDALRTARRGEYGDEIAGRMPSATLQRYFRARATGFVVTDAIRNMVRFSNQSLIKDPPFSQLDLICCRNVLIYFEKPLQTSVINSFHYGLREGGTLVLGNSEAINKGDALFDEISRHLRIFTRRPGPAARLDLRPADRPYYRPPSAQPQDDHALPPQPYAADVMTHFSPPYMVLTPQSDLVYASTSATAFLQVTGGRPQSSVLKMVRPELEPALGRLLRFDQKTDQTQSILFEGDLDGDRRRLRISGRQIADQNILVVFEDQIVTNDATIADPAAEGAETRRYTRELEAELDATRDRLRITMEELETSNEELKSSNEEMMSMNEELQSANEELTTTNDELNSKITEIRDSNADMSNFIKSNKISTVFLDEQLRLRRFTPEARNQFRFVTSDIGRPLDDIGSDLDVAQILDDCRAVMQTDKMMEAEYESRDGLTYRARIVPFDGDPSVGGGVVLSIFDVTELRRFAREAEEQRNLSEQRLTEIEDLYAVSPQAMGMLDENLRYVRANPRLADLCGTSVADLIGRPLGTLAMGLREEIEPMARDVLENQTRIENRQFRGKMRSMPDKDRVWETDWYPVYHNGVVAGVGVNVRDITDQIQMQYELRRVMQELQHRVKNMLANVLALVSRARRDATSDREVFSALSKRIQALAQTHKLLTQSNWSSANLRQVLEPELTAIYGADRIQMKGPEIVVNARAALSLGMAIHELATNAAKYGAFSVPDGAVRLSWVRQDDGESDMYIFRWKEQGGPEPTTAGDDGFGTQLIRSTITGSLNGAVTFDWEPDGLSCVLTIPVSALIEIPNESLFNSSTLQI